MPINNCTQEEIRAMKARLEQRREDRIIERQMDEAVRMAQRKRPFAQAPAQEQAEDGLQPVRGLISTAMLGIAGATVWNMTGSAYGLAVMGLCGIYAWAQIRSLPEWKWA